jgi:peptide/nickel transport system permease protein
MARFFAKHLLFVCLTPLVVSSVVFVLTEFVPGDVARKMLRADATQEQPEVPTKQIGLDRSVAACLVEYDDCLTQGDLVARHRNRSAADRPQGGRPA